MVTRINLWSCPRNVSTAFMYSWAQRADTEVFDEPLYAHFLRVSGVNHPGRDQILEAMENDGKLVVAETILDNRSAPVLFFKQMTHHLVELDEAFIGQTKNLLFIRDPREILASYAKVRAHPTLEDIGVKAQFDLWHRWAESGAITAVLDSRYLLMDPEGIWKQLCALLGIDYDPAVLSWPAGPRKEDGVWAPWWYANVHQSTGFQPYVPKKPQLPAHLEELAQECAPYYAFLTEKSIR